MYLKSNILEVATHQNAPGQCQAHNCDWSHERKWKRMINLMVIYLMGPLEELKKKKKKGFQLYDHSLAMERRMILLMIRVQSLLAFPICCYCNFAAFGPWVGKVSTYSVLWTSWMGRPENSSIFSNKASRGVQVQRAELFFWSAVTLWNPHPHMFKKVNTLEQELMQINDFWLNEPQWSETCWSCFPLPKLAALSSGQ